METTRFGNNAGFTLMELVVALAIISLIVGIAVPAITQLQEEAKATKILAVSDTMRKACEKHYGDTGHLATVDSSSTTAANHELFLTQSTVGWKGPYVDHMTTSGDNPFGGDVKVYESFASGTLAGGFDFDGDGSNDVTAGGQYVLFTLVPEGVAEMVDTALDAGIGGTWQDTGRVVWKSDDSGTVCIYLLTSK